MSVVISDASSRSTNKFRPRTFAGVIGQEPAKVLLKAAVARTRAKGVPMPHMLFVSQAGFGKTTFAHVVANEIGSDVYEVEAPVSLDTLMELRETMKDGDVLKVEEIHLQAIRERRGRGAATEPEAFYALMEDRVIPTQEGPLPFPAITVVGTTTDEGLLPDSFVDRFPLKPRLEPYTHADMVQLGARNARTIGLKVGNVAADLLASASRGVPRVMNNLVTNVELFMGDRPVIKERDVRYVLSLNGVTEDGLTPDMQEMMLFLFTKAKRKTAAGTFVYQASVSTIATAIGKSRDSKAIGLRVEPYLIQKGYVQVGHGGRILTDTGAKRAKQLLDEKTQRQSGV